MAMLMLMSIGMHAYYFSSQGATGAYLTMACGAAQVLRSPPPPLPSYYFLYGPTYLKVSSGTLRGSLKRSARAV